MQSQCLMLALNPRIIALARYKVSKLNSPRQLDNFNVNIAVMQCSIADNCIESERSSHINTLSDPISN